MFLGNASCPAAVKCLFSVLLKTIAIVGVRKGPFALFSNMKDRPLPEILGLVVMLCLLSRPKAISQFLVTLSSSVLLLWLLKIMFDGVPSFLVSCVWRDWMNHGPDKCVLVKKN